MVDWDAAIDGIQDELERVQRENQRLRAALRDAVNWMYCVYENCEDCWVCRAKSVLSESEGKDG